MRTLAAMVAGLAFVASSAAGQERVVLAPASDWVMNYDDDSCALQRQFGTEGQQAFLELRRFGPSDSLQVVVASADIRRRDGNQFEVEFGAAGTEARPASGFSIDFPGGYEGKVFSFNFEVVPGEIPREYIESAPGLSEEQRQFLLKNYDLPRSRRALRNIVEDPLFLLSNQLISHSYRQTAAWESFRADSERSVQNLVIEGAFRPRVTLQTGEMYSAFEQMRKCMDDLYAHWGFDPEQLRTLSRPVVMKERPDLVARLVERYPSDLVMRGQPGFLQVRMDVSSDGKPTACHLLSDINNEPAFEKAVCEIFMQHANFTAAADAQGQAVGSFYQAPILFVPSSR